MLAQERDGLLQIGRGERFEPGGGSGRRRGRLAAKRGTKQNR